MARISVLVGDVNVRRGDTGQLVGAAVNAPLSGRDRLQTGPGSRAEIELDGADLLRLGPNTDVGFADLQYKRYQVQLGAGTIVYRVLRQSDAQGEIDTPSIAVRAITPGVYRISVLDDGTTQIAVRTGEVEIAGPRGTQRERAGQSIAVRGNPSDPEFLEIPEVGRDQLEDWSAGRDGELLSSQSAGRVGPEVDGADDLDRYGNWVPSQYGDVWAPQEASSPDWSPYSNGSWNWVNYYGWTWVDAAPWGWAPYHYGRWFWNGGRGWCWWPGRRVGLHLWSPALVGFFGWGGEFGGGYGGLGWVALAPYESFHPWWGRRGYGYGYGAFPRAGNLAGIYRNAAVRGGAMTAGYDRFGGPGGRFSPATRVQLTNAGLFRGQLPVSPTRNSYQFANRQATMNPRLAASQSRQFFSSGQTGIAARSSWNSYGRGQSAPGAAYSNRQSPAVKTYSNSNNGSVGGEARGWQRFGDPGSGSANYRQSFSGAQERSGWHSFGQAQPSVPSYRQYNDGSGAGRGSYSGTQQRYSAPQVQHYSAPSQHYSAPSGSSRGGGGSSRSGGGGGGSGHHGR